MMKQISRNKTAYRYLFSSFPTVRFFSTVFVQHVCRKNSCSHATEVLPTEIYVPSFWEGWMVGRLRLDQFW